MSETNTNEQKTVDYSGLERYDDKIKDYIQDKIDSSGTGGSITVDSALSDASENPVQNKVVKAELDKKAEKSIYGDDSISLGRKADTVKGEHSVAIGDEVEASGNWSFAEGRSTIASGDFSHASGNGSTASGNDSYAGGFDSKAVGRASFVFGDNLIANRSCSAAFGCSNVSNEDTLFSIGDGLGSDGQTEDRHNAFEITVTGGKLHDKDIATADDIPTSLPANGGTANKLASSSYTTLTINTSDWAANSSGGYICTKTLSSAMAYEHFNFEVVLSSEQASAKLQIESWNYVMADGMITQTTSNGSTTAFTFYAFTTKPTVALTIAIQGVSGS